MPAPEHHTVIIVGGGPAGLPLAVVLGGWRPYYTPGGLFRSRYSQIDTYLKQVQGTLLGLDFQQIAAAGLSPVDLFRMLHHPDQRFNGEEEISLEFRREQGVDYLLITQESVGGLWNNIPENMLTLSPGNWMEFTFYPLSRFAREKEMLLNVSDLIGKRDLVNYYHHVPDCFEQADRIRTRERATRIEPHEKGFLITSRGVEDESERRYTCKYVVYAVGQRCCLRRLGVAGEELPQISRHYDRPEDYPGERIIVVGGGRTSDWAATELHDAGKHVSYVMRQAEDHHWRLINDSRYGLPYYARIAEIMESRSPKFKPLYRTQVERIEPLGAGCLATLRTGDITEQLEADHAIIEIGATADYSPLKGFPEFELIEKYDNYRFQVHQMATHPHNCESVAIPNFYPGGYLASGLGLVVIAMHGATYAIAGDIMQKEGLL
jgi:thioredoxin reductase